MKCPFCHHPELKVTDSRNAVDANAIKRRRECHKCGKRFTTFEMVELSLQVKKRDGSYEEFQEQKLIEGLEAACRHTSVSHEQIRVLAAKIATFFMERQEREITSKEIGEIVMKYLKSMDTIAYIRFACVYRRFRDIGELMEAIHSVSPEEGLLEVEAMSGSKE
jgi:transcriptional repressor NrdR